MNEKAQAIINETVERFGEWLEVDESNSSELMIFFLAQMLVKEREKSQYLHAMAYRK